MSVAESLVETPETKEIDNPNVKLFVGQIPRHVTDAELRKLFDPFGPIHELVILRDRYTQISKGAAFVTYTSKSAAENAIAAIHDKVTMHHRPLVVRYAGAQHMPTEAKLFVGMLSKSTTEERILSMFGKFGTVKEVYLMRDHNSVSKGCAFVKMASREDALAAVTTLHEQFQDEGAPQKLVVRFADTKQEKLRRQQKKLAMSGYGLGMLTADGGGLIPSLPRYGMMMPHIPHVYPLQSLSAPQPMSPASPMSPSYSLTDVHSARGLAGPAPLSAHSPAPSATPASAAASFVPMSPTPDPSSSYSPSASGSAFSSGNSPMLHYQTLPGAHVRGPIGANIFVYNIPETYADIDLANIFAQFGPIISAKVFRDKTTGASRGFGFVSFDHPLSAEKAIQTMDGALIGSKRLKVMLKKSNGAALATSESATSSPVKVFDF